MSKKLINLTGISKSYGDHVVLDDLNLYIRENEFITLLGPSGCGKTTTLRIIGGFEAPDAGSVVFDGKDITSLPPNERNLNTVFQKYALFPHMSIAENIAFGLRIKKKSKEYINDKIRYALKLVNLEGFENRSIDSLSGGQQQRIAIARAIVNEPKVLLLDEPLGALDLKLRQDMQYELIRLKNELGITFVFVTHDQEEALTISDTIVVMNQGYIQQIGTPEMIYNEPVNAFVADFIGDSNIINGTMIQDKVVEILGVKIPCVDEGFGCNTPVDVVIRPEDVEITEPGAGFMDGDIVSIIFKGVHYEITVESGRNEIVIQTTKSAKVGDKVGLNVEPDGIHIMISETAINKIESSVNRNYALGVFDGKVSCDLTEIVPGSAMKDGVLVDANGEAIDREKIKVIVSILPEDIDMSDDEEAGIICGHIINLIYKGDHYSYVVRTDNEEDFIVDDEYLWNMEDRVSLIIPEDKMKFSLKK